MTGRGAIAIIALATVGCGEFPRTIALDHRFEPACDVTMSSAGTSTTAQDRKSVV